MKRENCKHYRFDDKNKKTKSDNEEYCSILTELVCDKKNCTFYNPIVHFIIQKKRKII